MSLDKQNYKIDEKLKKAYINSFNGVSDEIYYLIIICTKILRCDVETKLIEADIDRLYDEFVYFKYYSKMSKDYLLDFFMPLMLASRGFDNYEETAKNLSEKLCRFYGIEGKKYEYIMDVFCYDIIMRNLLMENFDMLDILNKVKDGLIEFNPYMDSKIDNVKFQVKKIKYIENLHKCIDNYEFEITYDICETGIGVVDVLQCAFNEEYFENYSRKSDYGIISVYNVLKSLMDSENKADEKIETAENFKSSIYRSFIKAMAEHLLRIRYGQVKIGKYNLKASPREFLNREVGEEFADPILSRVKIDSREVIKEDGNSRIAVELSTKTGKYRFEYKIVENR